MATTTVSSVAGLLQYITADAYASYLKSAVTPNAVMVVEAMNAKSVLFPTLAATPRNAYGSSHAEGTTIPGYQVPISATEAALLEYPIVSPVSKLALKGGPAVAQYVGQLLGRQIANTVDYNVCALISGGVTTTAVSTDGFSMADLMTGVGTVDALGFSGERKVAILHPLSYWGSKGLATNLVGTAHPQANAVADEVFKAGWVNNIAGVDIYLSNMVTTYTGGTIAANVVMAQSCIGLGIHSPLVELDYAFTPLTNTIDFSAATYHKAVVVHADAGYCVLATL